MILTDIRMVVNGLPFRRFVNIQKETLVLNNCQNEILILF